MRFNTIYTVSRVIFFLFIIFAGLPPQSTAAGENTQRNILVLLSYHPSLPWTESFMAGLEQEKKKYGNHIQFFTENMESIRLPDSMSDDDWVDYLTKKYRSIRFDGVIAESFRACEFLSRNRQRFQTNIPHVYYTDIQTEEMESTKTLQIQQTDSVKQTFLLALRQNPDTKQIVIIDGQSESSIEMIDSLKQLIKEKNNLQLNVIRDFTLDDLEKKMAALPSDSVVFYTLVFSDGTGKQFIPKDVLSSISKVSAAPIYSFWSSLMGSGIVGGDMIDGTTTAVGMFTAVMDYVEEQGFKNNYETLRTFVDWKAITKYKINHRLIPADAVIINKPDSLFKSHLREIMLGIIIVIVLFLLATLFWVRKLSLLNKMLEVANHEISVAKIDADSLARTDQMTGMNNRRAFFEKSEQVYKELKRFDKPSSVLMLDIDHFKKINDTYGHPTGDEVIKTVAKVIEKSKREIDISARFGGEEFVIIVPFTDVMGAKHLARRIREDIEKTVVSFEGNSLQFTVSIGVCGGENQTTGHSLEEALKLADEALYHAKEQGRNRVVVYSETQTGLS